MQKNYVLTSAERRAIVNAKARDHRRAVRNAEIDAFLAGVREEFPELARVMDAPAALGPLKVVAAVDHDRPEALTRD